MGALMALDPLVSQAVGADDQVGITRAVQRGLILSVVEATEAFDRAASRAQALEMAELLGITPTELNRAQLDALAWAEGLAV